MSEKNVIELPYMGGKLLVNCTYDFDGRDGPVHVPASFKVTGVSKFPVKLPASLIEALIKAIQGNPTAIKALQEMREAE